MGNGTASGPSNSVPVDLVAWTAIAGEGERSRDCWARLIRRWSEPHRAYHGLGHLSAVLLFIEDYADHAADADAVRLAAWYHDAIYAPRAADNEEASAALAESELGELTVRPERIAEAARLVRLTSGHSPDAGDRNAELLLDADLLILSSPPEAYVAYLNAIRAEYEHVNDENFRTGRTAVLNALLELPRIYHLESLSPMEDLARRNISAELSLLQGGPSSRAAEPGGAAEPGDEDPPAEERPGPPDR